MQYTLLDWKKILKQSIIFSIGILLLTLTIISATAITINTPTSGQNITNLYLPITFDDSNNSINDTFYQIKIDGTNITNTDYKKVLTNGSNTTTIQTNTYKNLINYSLGNIRIYQSTISWNTTLGETIYMYLNYKYIDGTNTTTTPINLGGQYNSVINPNNVTPVSQIEVWANSSVLQNIQLSLWNYTKILTNTSLNISLSPLNLNTGSRTLTLTSFNTSNNLFETVSTNFNYIYNATLNVYFYNITNSLIPATITISNTNGQDTRIINSTNGTTSINVVETNNYNTTTNSTGYINMYNDVLINSLLQTLNITNIYPSNSICFNFYDMLYGTNLTNINATLAGTSVYSWITNNSACKYNLQNGIYTLVATKNNYTTYTSTVTLSSTTLNNQTIYMTNSGAIVTIYVKNIYDQYLSGATVTVKRQIDNQIIASGTTDFTGAIPIVVDTNMQYSVTVSSPGYVTNIGTLTPTSTTLIITLASPTNTTPNYYAGITTYFSPDIGSIILNNTIYQFNFTYTNNYWTITNCYITMLDENENIITIGTTNCGNTSGSGTITLNTNNYTYLTLIPTLTIKTIDSTTNTTNYVNVSYKQMFQVKYFYTGDYSIAHAITDFKNFNKSGFDNTNRFLIVFIAIFAIIIAAARNSINKYVSSTALLGLLFFLVLLACNLQLCTLPLPGLDSTGLNGLLARTVSQYGVALLVGALWLVTIVMNWQEGNDG